MTHHHTSRCTYHGRPGDDSTDFYPTFKQEADMERESFRRNVYANIETAEAVLFDAAQALRAYPGYEAETQALDLEIARLEDLREGFGYE